MPKVRDMLGTFLFRGDDVYKPVSVLSGGEKSRLALLQMLLKPMNLLILDEPTNHLDLHSKDVLLEALRQFIETIIFVSHDRAFMEALSTKTLELSPATDPASPTRARLFYGNYGYYLEKIASETTADGSDKNVVVNTADSKGTAKERAQNKQRQAAELLNAIAELESEKSRLETELSRPEVYSVGEKASAVQRKLDACAAALKEKTAEWEELAAKMLDN